MSDKEYMHLKHTNKPVWDCNCESIILGTFPSVLSRKNKFFYGNPQNRFWRVMAHVLGFATPQTVEEKKNMLLSCKIALWDVIDECDIIGSSDSSIKNVIPNNVSEIINKSAINKIFVNGATAERLYNKYLFKTINIKPILLPSTSPANASYSFERLCDKWAVINEKQY